MNCYFQFFIKHETNIQKAKIFTSNKKQFPNNFLSYKNFPYKKMNTNHRQLLQSIQQNYNNQSYLSSSDSISPPSLFVSLASTRQQLFLQKLINIYVLRKKEYNKISLERISQLIQESSGSFTDSLLGMRYMSYCMENKIEVTYERIGMLKLLTKWMDVFEKVKSQEKVSLCKAVLGVVQPENHCISTVEELIVYLNYIAVDLQQIIERPQNKPTNIQSSASIQLSSQTASLSHLQPQDLTLFLSNILPKSLYNIVIPEHLIVNRPLTTTNPQQQRGRDFLFSAQSIQYFAKQKTHYQHLLKLIITTLLKFDLEQSLQRQLMLAVFRYFFLFNRNKQCEPFSLWTKVYEKLSEAVRFALCDQFILFFKVIKKLGHVKFIEYLKNKYSFVSELLVKLDTNAIIGYPKDSLSPFHSFPIMQHIFVNPGTQVERYIQILQPYSLLYFYIGVKSLDINIRFYYLGQFTSQIQKKQLLLNKQKCQVQFKGNIIALQKGIYSFQLDNTYSWVKGKSVYYDAMVLTPLDLKRGEQQREKFLNVLFNKFQMNSCAQVNDVRNLGYRIQGQVLSSQQSSVQQQEKLNVNMQYDQETKIYNLKTVGNGKIYQYETDNPELFKKKANDIYQTLQQSKGSAFQWLVGGGIVLAGVWMIEQWCMDPVGFSVEEVTQENVVLQQVIEPSTLVQEKEKVLGLLNQTQDKQEVQTSINVDQPLQQTAKQQQIVNTQSQKNENNQPEKQQSLQQNQQTHQLQNSQTINQTHDNDNRQNYPSIVSDTKETLKTVQAQEHLKTFQAQETLRTEQAQETLRKEQAQETLRKEQAQEPLTERAQQPLTERVQGEVKGQNQEDKRVQDEVKQQNQGDKRVQDEVKQQNQGDKRVQDEVKQQNQEDKRVQEEIKGQNQEDKIIDQQQGVNFDKKKVMKQEQNLQEIEVDDSQQQVDQYQDEYQDEEDGGDEGDE